jgi:hypothetical protein
VGIDENEKSDASCLTVTAQVTKFSNPSGNADGRLNLRHGQPKLTVIVMIASAIRDEVAPTGSALNRGDSFREFAATVDCWRDVSRRVYRSECLGRSFRKKKRKRRRNEIDTAEATK